MRMRLSSCLATLAVVAFAVPVWAHSKSTPLTLSQPATIGTVSLKPGNYTLTADTQMNEIMVKQQDGKVIATVPGREVTLKRKPEYTAVLFNHRQIQEIQFEGKTEAVKVD